MSASSDTLKPFLLEEHGIRGFIVQMDATWRAVLERHPYPPALRDRVGELMTAAALLTATLRYKGSLTIQLKGNGPLRWLWVECTSNYGLRATAHWSGEPEGNTLRALVGDARLTLTIDPTEGRERYQGIVSVEGDTLATALESYLARSEQLTSRLWLYADSQTIGGLLLQKMPDNESVDPDAWNRACLLADTVSARELAEHNATEIIRRLFHEEDVRVFERVPVSFRCTCSRERVIRTLRTLGAAEIRPLVEERGEVAVDCEFCHQHYVFDAVDIEQIFASDALDRGSSTHH